MEYPVLDSRLSAIAAWCGPGRPAVDVGADHGYLISYLAAKGIVPRGIACDINPQPLEKSRETVRRAVWRARSGASSPTAFPASAPRTPKR